MGGFSVDLVLNWAGVGFGDERVQKWYAVIIFDFHGELYVSVLVVEMVEEVVEMLSVMRPNDESIIDVSKPEFWFQRC